MTLTKHDLDQIDKRIDKRFQNHKEDLLEEIDAKLINLKSDIFDRIDPTTL
ncbi:MAG: hypothetical protein ACD_52C00024G0004 [uncultured bacterium]|nr:MAG: hypothetical protein ACD_52C00024G0004 [uncultured bacterium]